MKRFILLLISITLLTSCSNEDNLPSLEKFNLTMVSGGFAGITETFEKGEIVWTLDEGNSILTVEKNTEENFSGIAEGTYSYGIQEINNDLYFFIDNSERGGLTISTNEMILDGNKKSGGAGADFFILHFEK